jgi:hypothetical protein
MQSVKLVVRRVGVPTPELDVISVGDLEEYIQYQLTSQGYILKGTPEKLEEIKNQAGGVVGWTFAMWFVKSDEPEESRPEENLTGEAYEVDSASRESKPKRGRKSTKQ